MSKVALFFLVKVSIPVHIIGFWKMVHHTFDKLHALNSSFFSTDKGKLTFSISEINSPKKII